MFETANGQKPIDVHDPHDENEDWSRVSLFWLPLGGQASATSFCNGDNGNITFNSDFRLDPDVLERLESLGAHEFGHQFGLGHTSDANNNTPVMKRPTLDGKPELDDFAAVEHHADEIQQLPVEQFRPIVANVGFEAPDGTYNPTFPEIPPQDDVPGWYSEYQTSIRVTGAANARTGSVSVEMQAGDLYKNSTTWMENFRYNGQEDHPPNGLQNEADPLRIVAVSAYVHAVFLQPNQGSASADMWHRSRTLPAENFADSAWPVDNNRHPFDYNDAGPPTAWVLEGSSSRTAANMSTTQWRNIGFATLLQSDAYNLGVRISIRNDLYKNGSPINIRIDDATFTTDHG